MAQKGGGSDRLSHSGRSKMSYFPYNANPKPFSCNKVRLYHNIANISLKSVISTSYENSYFSKQFKRAKKHTFLPISLHINLTISTYYDIIKIERSQLRIRPPPPFDLAGALTSKIQINRKVSNENNQVSKKSSKEKFSTIL
jgi:hypothetical protein